MKKEEPPAIWIPIKFHGGPADKRTADVLFKIKYFDFPIETADGFGVVRYMFGGQLSDDGVQIWEPK